MQPDVVTSPYWSWVSGGFRLLGNHKPNKFFLASFITSVLFGTNLIGLIPLQKTGHRKVSVSCGIDNLRTSLRPMEKCVTLAKTRQCGPNWVYRFLFYSEGLDTGFSKGLRNTIEKRKGLTVDFGNPGGGFPIATSSPSEIFAVPPQMAAPRFFGGAHQRGHRRGAP
jgi:hypothetical protein